MGFRDLYLRFGVRRAARALTVRYAYSAISTNPLPMLRRSLQAVQSHPPHPPASQSGHPAFHTPSVSSAARGRLVSSSSTLLYAALGPSATAFWQRHVRKPFISDLISSRPLLLVRTNTIEIFMYIVMKGLTNARCNSDPSVRFHCIEQRCYDIPTF